MKFATKLLISIGISLSFGNAQAARTCSEAFPYTASEFFSSVGIDPSSHLATAIEMRLDLPENGPLSTSQIEKLGVFRHALSTEQIKSIQENRSQAFEVSGFIMLFSDLPDLRYRVRLIIDRFEFAPQTPIQWLPAEGKMYIEKYSPPLAGNRLIEALKKMGWKAETDSDRGVTQYRSDVGQSITVLKAETGHDMQMFNQEDVNRIIDVITYRSQSLDLTL